MAMPLGTHTAGSHCWWCNKRLAAKPDGGYYFAVYVLPSGGRVRVHKVCLPAARAFNTALTASSLDLE